MLRRLLVPATLAFAATACGTAPQQVAVDAQPARAVVAQQASSARPRVLFIRGANGTAGTDTQKGPDDHELARITDLNSEGLQESHGYGLWARTLVDEGFDVSELHETGSLPKPDKVKLKDANLGQYAAVIFGSNNATYDGDDAKTIDNYLRNGGGVLFLSDLNFASQATLASISDNQLMQTYGIQLTEDNTQESTITTANIKVADHPTVAGVTSIKTLGVSACTITPFANRALFVPEVVIRYPDQVLELNGTKRNPTDDDGALVVWQSGKGRGACFYDRDPFFNTHLDQNSHKQLGLNLVNWLAGRTQSN